MAVTDRELAREQLKNLLSQGSADETSEEISQEEGEVQASTVPDVHEATRKLLEQVVELARMPAPQINVQPASVHLPSPTVHVDAPNVTVQAPAAASAIPWTFEFERYPNGSLKKIHAIPKLETE